MVPRPSLEGERSRCDVESRAVPHAARQPGAPPGRFMGVGRTAPHRIHAAYERALRSIPLPVRAVSAPIEETLTVLGQTQIGDRLVHYGTMIAAPRLWLAFPGCEPPVFGYLTGLAAGTPVLQVTDQTHLAWTRESGHSEALIRYGLTVWRGARRTCEG